MMRKIALCSSIILLIGVKTTYSGYCNAGPDCCPNSGLGKRSCNGTGTSDCADYFGYTFRDKTQYFLAGTYLGFYYFWSMTYRWQPGVQATAVFDAIYAYFIQYPNKNCVGYTLYCIEVSNCPQMYELKACSEGCFTGTNFPKKVAYRRLRQLLEISLSGTSAFQYRQMYDDNQCTCDAKSDPETVSRKYGLQIEKAKDCCDKHTYKQRGYVSGSQYACVDNTGAVGLGKVLSDTNYTMQSVYGPGGFCAFSQYCGALLAGSRTSSFFGYVKYAIVEEPYKFIIFLDVYFPFYLFTPVLQAFLDQLC